MDQDDTSPTEVLHEKSSLGGHLQFDGDSPPGASDDPHPPSSTGDPVQGADLTHPTAISEVQKLSLTELINLTFVI